MVMELGKTLEEEVGASRGSTDFLSGGNGDSKHDDS